MAHCDTPHHAALELHKMLLQFLILHRVFSRGLAVIRSPPSDEDYKEIRETMNEQRRNPIPSVGTISASERQGQYRRSKHILIYVRSAAGTLSARMFVENCCDDTVNVS